MPFTGKEESSARTALFLGGPEDVERERAGENGHYSPEFPFHAKINITQGFPKVPLCKLPSPPGTFYAAECLHYAEEIAGTAHCYKMMLLTGSKQESTLNFYRNAGYNSADKTAFIKWLEL